HSAPEHLGLAIGSGIGVLALGHGVQKGKQADDGTGPFDDQQNPIRRRKHAPSLRGYRGMLPQRPVGRWGSRSTRGGSHPPRDTATRGFGSLLVVGPGVLLRAGAGVRGVVVRAVGTARLRRTTGLCRAGGLRRAPATRRGTGLRGTAPTRRAALTGSGALGLVHRPTGLPGSRLVGRLTRGAASLGGDVVSQLLDLRSSVCGSVLDRLGSLLTAGAGPGGHHAECVVDAPTRLTDDSLDTALRRGQRLFQLL